MSSPDESLFPKFANFAAEINLVSRVKGALSPKVHRILGYGTTKATGLDLPPAAIERQQELASLSLPEDIRLPESVKQEIQEVKHKLAHQLELLRSDEGRRSLCSRVVAGVGKPSGLKNGYFYADRFLLIFGVKTLRLAWSVTPHYPVIANVPPDEQYLKLAFEAAERVLGGLMLDVAEFEKKLRLSYLLARHFGKGGDVLMVDVARYFLVAFQEQRFWNSPRRQFFRDVPEAAFIANYMKWRQEAEQRSKARWGLTPGTLQQVHSLPVYYLPTDQEGTQTKPYVYVRMIDQASGSEVRQ